MTNLKRSLVTGSFELGLALTDDQVSQLLAYLDLIRKWNQVYNLTAVRDLAEMLSHHLLDSLAAVQPLQRELEGGAAGRLLDVGSGAGLPGVVLAICMPGLTVDCVDTVAKKAAFVQQCAAQFKLPNLRGLHDRVEHLAGPYDVISSRAFSSLSDFVTLSSQALAEGGKWLAMKGKLPAEEIAALPPTAEVFHVEQLVVPGLKADRCIVWMRKTAAALT